MRIIDADRLKADHKSKIVINLIDPIRGIDLSHYAEDSCINFNKLVDNQPTVDVFDKIRGEIEQSFDGYLVVDKDIDYASNTFKGQPAITINHVFEIIGKYKAESEEQE